MVMQSFTASCFTSANRYGLGYSNMNNYPETRYSSARRRYSRDYYPNVSSGYGGGYGGMGGYGGGYGGMGGYGRSMGGYGGMGGYGRGGGY
jgi:hypothetical protein